MPINRDLLAKQHSCDGCPRGNSHPGLGCKLHLGSVEAGQPFGTAVAAGVVFEMVTRTEGATLEELTVASGLAVASVRGVISIYARDKVHFDRRIGRYLPTV